MKRQEVTPSEYNAYYGNYITQVSPEKDLLTALREGLEETVNFYKGLPQEKWEYSYAPKKWTPKEILLHLIDTERIFAYRALRFSRADYTALPGFEQDDYVIASNANDRDIESLIQEYKATRMASIALFDNLSSTALSSSGEASGSPMSGRAAGFIICGHERHHCTIIKDRYL